MTLGGLLLALPALTSAGDLIFDWGIRYHPTPVAGITPIVRAVDDPATAVPTDYTNPLQVSYTNGEPVGFILRNPSAPIDGADPGPNAWEDRDTLAKVLTWIDAHGVRLDYVFADFELHVSTASDPQQRLQENMAANNANLQAVIDQVHGHANPKINNARIGNFNHYAGSQMLAQPFLIGVDRTPVDTFYRTAHYNNVRAMTVSMPDIYPMDYHKTHAVGSPWNEWGAFSSPNVRSALLWAPLENISNAKRHLPAGDLLIPWVSTFVPWNQDPVAAADRPTAADYRALLQHARLRGADGYYTWEDSTAPIDLVQTKANWHDLNWFFALPGSSTVLNTDTNKTTGLEWSGVRRGGRSLVLATNTSGATANVPFTPAATGLPSHSPVLANNSHSLLQYLVTPALDEDFESYPPYVAVGTFDFGSNAQDWEMRPGPAGNSTLSLARKNAAAWKTTWFELATPAFQANDRVVYSTKLYSGERNAGTVAGSGFGPCFVDQGLRSNPANVPNADKQGVFVEFVGNTNTMRVQLNMTGGPVMFVANDANLLAANTWYEVQLVVKDAANGGLGQIFVRNLSQNGSFVSVDFDDATQAGTQHVTEIPLFFADPYLKPTQFNGWEVYGYNSTVYFDDFRARLYPQVEQYSGAAP